MKRLLLTILLIAPGSVYCQVEAKTSDGKTVLLADDGTWKYLETGGEQTSVSDKESQLSFTEKLDIRRFIEQSEMDPIDNKWRLSTRTIRIDHEVGFRYRSIGKAIFLLFYRNESDVIGSDDQLVLLFKSGKKISLKSTGIQSGQVQYYISPDQVNLLASSQLILVRFYTTDGYSDYKITGGARTSEIEGIPLASPEQVMRLTQVYLDEYSNHNK